MTRTYAAWAEPIAARFAATRSEIIEFALQVPADRWDVDSAVPGWAYRDILAHLAEGNFFCRAVLQAVVDGTDTDMRTFSALKEDRIANALARGRDMSVPEVIDRVTSDGEDMALLLSRLTPEHADYLVITSRTNPEPATLSEFLSSYHHDEEHLAQLRTALPEMSTTR